LHKGRELFINTTYLLPFLQVPIRTKGFNLSDFRKFIAKLSRVHVSELSVYEAKAKLLRMSRSRGEYGRMLSTSGENLNVLRADEKFIFRTYTKEDDRRFNQLVTVGTCGFAAPNFVQSPPETKEHHFPSGLKYPRDQLVEFDIA
jgi:hypothetical protein